MSPEDLSAGASQRRLEGQSGFTLAGLLIILTVLSVAIAYTVPAAWSQIVKREREIQTVWVMKQYARAIYEFQRKRNALPASLDQLKEQNTPRVLRTLYPDPLTGEMDWILVPPGTAPGGPQQQGGTVTTTQLSTAPPGAPGDYQGPFVGVRPPVAGESYISLNGADRYENWVYTVNELQQELSRVGRPGTVQQPPR